MPLLLLVGLLSCRSHPVSPPPVLVEAAPTGSAVRSDPPAETDGADTTIAGPVPVTPPAPPAAPLDQIAAAAELHPRSVLEAQPYRRTSTIPITRADGGPGVATLVDLAPAVGVWHILTLEWEGSPPVAWHLENPSGARQALRLDPAFPTGLVLSVEGKEQRCELWSTSPDALAAARATRHTYAALCDGALALRNPTRGHRTSLEWTTDVLRDHVWGGEAITSVVKSLLLDGSEPETAPLVADGASAPAPVRGAPVAASTDPGLAGSRVPRRTLGLPLDGGEDRLLTPGAWYPVRGVPGAWAGVIEAHAVDPSVHTRLAPTTSPLEPEEAHALVYTVAFDLSAFDLGFELGTDHPRVGWSGRVPASVRDAGLPGPDGYADLSPLARTGMLDPAWQQRTAAVFVGGFKRAHGAFANGELSTRNGGSHYGFVQHGVVLSRLVPGLATLVVWDDGQVELRTWTEADAARAWRVRHARQNGVPILDVDPESGEVVPGALIRSWGLGNWSGSAEGDLRTIRGGVCLQESDAGRFLLYSYFSSATPSAMARVYAGYGCRYAMLLDMNALEHTYLAVLVPEAGALRVDHLVEGMEVLDKESDGATYPRFVGYADNRDFFYLMRKPTGSSP